MNLYLSPVIAFFLIPFSNSLGDFVIAVDATSGGTVNNFATIAPGTNFDVDVVVGLTGSSTLSAYQFSIQYDAHVMQFNPASSQEFLPTDFDFQVSGLTVDPIVNGIGQVSGIDAAALGTGPAAPTVFVAARLNFTALTPFDDGLDFNEIFPGFFSFGDSAFDATFPFAQPITPHFQGADFAVTAVPEPSSLLLVGLTSALALFRMRRDRRGRDCCSICSRSSVSSTLR